MLGEWGPLRPGSGMRGWQPRNQEPTSRAPLPAPPRASWDSSHPPRCQPRAAPWDRVALSRVLTAEWPAPGSRASTVPRAPSRRDLAPGAGRMEAGAQGWSLKRVGRDARVGFSNLTVRLLLFWALRVFADPLPAGRGNAEGGREEGGTWRSVPAQRNALPPPR